MPRRRRRAVRRPAAARRARRQRDAIAPVADRRRAVAAPAHGAAGVRARARRGDHRRRLRRRVPLRRPAARCAADARSRRPACSTSAPSRRACSRRCARASSSRRAGRARRWSRVKHCVDSHCDTVTQSALAAFIRDGHLARHVRRMRPIYAERREALLDGLRRELADWLEPIPCEAGLHLAARVREPRHAAGRSWARCAGACRARRSPPSTRCTRTTWHRRCASATV